MTHGTPLRPEPKATRYAISVATASICSGELAGSLRLPTPADAAAASAPAAAPAPAPARLPRRTSHAALHMSNLPPPVAAALHASTHMPTLGIVARRCGGPPPRSSSVYRSGG